jgi:ABC-type bacteriocin/lantibiotic exporter with double-glycine peptidase domain
MAHLLFSSASMSFSLIDAPCGKRESFHISVRTDNRCIAELLIGTIFLYQLLGYAGIAGIATTILFLPINHYTSKSFASVQGKLMAARDKRVSLMNEVLSSIRYIKFMAYERAFEQRILKAREEEIRQQRKNYMLEVAFNLIWSTSPITCVLVSFFVYTKIMHQSLTPSIAFTSLAVFHELEYAINVLPDTFISALQCFVSIKRIRRFLAHLLVKKRVTEHGPQRSTSIYQTSKTLAQTSRLYLLRVQPSSMTCRLP